MAQLDQVDVRTAPLDTQREDIMQTIVDVSKIPLVFIDAIGRDTHNNQFSEWLCDRLAAPDVTNQIIDGSGGRTPSNARAIKLGNNSQIAIKTVGTSVRYESSNIAGNLKLAQQVQKKTQELWRDINAICLYNQANDEDDGVGSATPGVTAGLEAWVDTDEADETGATKSPAVISDVSTAGTITAGGWSNRTGDIIPAVAYSTVTEGAISFGGIMDVLDAMFQLGVSPSKLVARTTPLRKLSAFLFTSSAQIASLVRDANEMAAAQAVNAVNQIITDNGVVVDLCPDRLMQQSNSGASDTIFAIDPNYLKLSFQGGGPTVLEQPIDGLGRKIEVYADFMLKVTNPDALGAQWGIDDSLAAVA